MIRRQEGFTVIEVVIAAMILLVGVLGLFSSLSVSQKLSLVGERQTSLANRAQQELERLQSMPFQQLAMTVSAPTPSGCPNPLTAAYPTSPDCYAANGSFSYDRANPSKTESLVIDAAKGTITPNAAGSGCSDGCTSTWSDTRLSGEIFDFVSWMSDPNCPTGGTICSGSNGNSAENYKRITVVVTMNGVAHPAKPMLVSTIVADPNALPSGAPSNAMQNPLQSVNTQCGGGSCTQALTGTAVDYYLTDSPSGGSYQPPTASHPLHQTLTSFACTLGGLPSTCPPKPDQLITTPPSTGGELPPCAATNLGCVTSTPIPAAGGGGPGPNPCNGGIAPTDANGNCSTGLRLPHPSADSSSCPSPPVDNTRSHSWVSSAIPTGTTVNLAGTGGMTMFMQSAGSTAVNVTLCAGVYIQPGGLLGTVTTLLPPAVTQIGATVSRSAQATAGAPTPVSFGFNLGQAATLTSTPGSPVRIELVVWLAASAGSDVALVYDHPYMSSQMTLIEH